jgi:hypothetical protein
MLIGVAVLCLFVAWLSTRIYQAPVKAVPVTYIQQVGGGMPSGIVGESMQLDSPTAQDVARESTIVEPEFKAAVASVLDAVAARQAELDDPALLDQAEMRGGGRQKGTGTRPGWGLGGDGYPGILPHKRWEIYFTEGATIDLYARELDFFGIELGVYTGTNEMVYVSNLSRAKPDVRTAPPDQKRLYMSWRQGSLKQADRDLLARAGVPAAGKLILQFYPEAVEQTLLRLERDFRGRDASTIRKTRFAMRTVGNGFELYVIDQSNL